MYPEKIREKCYALSGDFTRKSRMNKTGNIHEKAKNIQPNIRFGAKMVPSTSKMGYNSTYKNM